MRDQHLRGLSPAISELVHPLLAWPNMELRWRGELDTTAIIRSIGNSGESSAIPALLSYALVPYSEVQDAARIAISTIYEQMSPSQLVPLDEALRTAWAHVEDWYGQKVLIKNLKVGESRDLIHLGLMCSHRSGFVRADAIGALGKAESEKAIPFLMIRLIDWVEKARLDADVELIKKIKPRFASSFVRYLGLLRRLTLHSRFRPGYRDSIHNMLKDPTCSSDVVAVLESNDQTVRREASAIAVGNPAIQVREVVARVLKEKDVVIRSWAFSDGLVLLPANEFDWARIAASDAYAPIRDKGFSRMVSSSASTEELAPFLFDRCTGIRRTCQSVLKQLGLSVGDIYRAALTKEGAKQTEIAALGLGETGDASDSPRLLNLLSYSSTRVREAKELMVPLLANRTEADGDPYGILERKELRAEGDRIDRKAWELHESGTGKSLIYEAWARYTRRNPALVFGE